jgi:transposase
MQVSVFGIDLGKNSCSLVGLDGIGKVVVRRRMLRETVIAFAAKLPPCIVAMEACCGAHHMGHALAAQGHMIRLMSPEYVRPYGSTLFHGRAVRCPSRSNSPAVATPTAAVERTNANNASSRGR